MEKYLQNNKATLLAIQLRPLEWLRGVDQIANQRSRCGLGQGGCDCGDVFGQQHARAFVAGLSAVAVKAVLPGDPTEQGRARFSARAAVCSGRQYFGELGHAPAGQAIDIGHAGYCEPAVAIGHNRIGIAIGGELLSGQSGALRGGQRLDEFRQPALSTRWSGMAAWPRSGWISACLSLMAAAHSQSAAFGL